MITRKFFFKTSIGILPILFLLSCSTTKQIAKEESFETFYERFHQDSLFQLSRLELPMQGLLIEGNQIQPGFESPWVMHKVGKNQLDREIFKVEQVRQRNRIIERIYEPGSILYNERHFELVNRQWFLVYNVNIFIL